MRFAKRITKLQKTKYYFLLIVLLLIVNQGCKSKSEITSSQSDLPEKKSFIVIMGGTKVGHLNVIRTGDTVVTDFDYKDNGRGPTIKETIILNKAGFQLSGTLLVIPHLATT